MALFRCGAGSSTGFPAEGEYIKYSTGGVVIGQITPNTPIDMNHSNSCNMFANVKNLSTITIDGPVNVDQFVGLYGVINGTSTQLTYVDATPFNISAYDYVYVMSQTSLSNVVMNITFA